jgi:hypothetical protein
VLKPYQMARPRLIIVCGVPGSGKSTFALHAAHRWGAISFASETFADALGAAARTASGDLRKEAIVHAYSAMAAAVADALSRRGLVIAVRIVQIRRATRTLPGYRDKRRSQRDNTSHPLSHRDGRATGMLTTCFRRTRGPPRMSCARSTPS